METRTQEYTSQQPSYTGMGTMPGYMRGERTGMGGMTPMPGTTGTSIGGPTMTGTTGTKDRMMGTGMMGPTTGMMGTYPYSPYSGISTGYPRTEQSMMETMGCGTCGITHPTNMDFHTMTPQMRDTIMREIMYKHMMMPRMDMTTGMMGPTGMQGMMPGMQMPYQNMMMPYQGMQGMPYQGMQGMMSGMQGMMPGYQGMMPYQGMQGTMPGMQGTMPGMQGMMPGMQATMPRGEMGLGPDMDKLDIYADWWKPRVDVFEEGNDIRIEFELPGIPHDNIGLKITENSLVLSSLKPKSRREEAGYYYMKERHFGNFFRRIMLPDFVDTSKITAHLINGVLKVTIPKTTTGATGTTGMVSVQPQEIMQKSK